MAPLVHSLSMSMLFWKEMKKNSHVFFNPGILYIGPLAFFSINGSDLYYHSYCKCKITENSKMTQFPVFYETGRQDDSEKYKAHGNINSIRVDSRSIQPMPPESLKCQPVRYLPINYNPMATLVM